MPPRLDYIGAAKTQSINAARRVDYDYKYPEGLVLHPSKGIHQSLVDMILRRAHVAREKNQERWSDWEETEKSLTAAVDLSASERALKNKDKDIPVKIVVPYSYAAMETILTYLVTAYLSQPPLFQYEGVSSDDTMGNKLLEVLVQRQVDHYKAILALYTWLRDGLSYGIGAVSPVWVSDRQIMMTKSVEQIEMLDGSIREQETTKREDRVLFEGTELNSIGPRYMLLDPNAAAQKIQNSEFFGWVEETSVIRLLEMEKTNPDTWFNVKYVRKAGPTKSIYAVKPELYENQTLSPTTLVHMYINLIPSDWELPTGEGVDPDYPQKWLFTVADDWCIVRAEPLEASHGKFPAVINAPDFDGYSTYPLARLEIIDGLQTTLDWLFNSHISNVRKMVNNQIVVDPSLVELNSLMDSKAGGIIKLKANAWGKDVKNALYQLPVNDVTKGHINDASSIIDMMQRVSGATDGLMGIARKGGERVSATESRTISTSATNRLEKLARLVSAQGLYDLGIFYATNTQDYMSQEIQLRVLGNWPEELVTQYGLGNAVNISPNSIDTAFDTVVRDGSLPVDSTGVAESWIQLYQIMMTNPALLQQYDMGRVFVHIAKLLGAKNVNDFKVIGNVTGNENFQRQVEAGNMVPVEEYS